MPVIIDRAVAVLEDAARQLNLALTIDTSLTLLWVLTGAIGAILLGQVVTQLVKHKLDKRKNAPKPAMGPPLPNTPKPLSIWHRLILRSLPLLAPVLNLLAMMLGAATLAKMGHSTDLLAAMQPLMLSWLFVAAVYAVTASIGKTIFVGILLVPLSLPFVAPYLADASNALSSLSLKVGKIDINAYMIIKLIITGVLLMWIAAAIRDGVNVSLSRMQHVRWSTRQLLQNLSTIGIYVFSVLIGLSILGIDLTAFAVLGGALGVGIGLGLQKIASNFISGLILLSEQSIQVNDMIEIAGANTVMGLVKHTGARYTLVETLDSREIMIPNDDLITNRVINWTYTNARGVIRIDIGVSYESDLALVKQELLAAAADHPAALKDPAPSCLLNEFGTSSVNFVVFLHVQDVREKRMTIRSEVLMDIWARFKANGIEIPYAAPAAKAPLSPAKL